MAVPIVFTVSCRFSIACESDSGQWLLLLHLAIEGKDRDTVPLYWFSSKADAEDALERIRNV